MAEDEGLLAKKHGRGETYLGEKASTSSIFHSKTYIICPSITPYPTTGIDEGHRGRSISTVHTESPVYEYL